MEMRKIQLLVSLLSVTVAIHSCSQLRNITWADDIADIVHSRCSPCHTHTSADTMGLVSYEEVKAKAKIIQYMIERERMPPWPADHSYGQLASALVLSDDEKEKFVLWVGHGCPRGGTDVSAWKPNPPYPWDSGYVQRRLDELDIDRVIHSKKIEIDSTSQYPEQQLERANHLYAKDEIIIQNTGILSMSPSLGRAGMSFLSYAYLDADTIPILSIPQWYPDWKFAYTMAHPILIPQGYHLVFLYEDSASEVPSDAALSGKVLSLKYEYITYEEGDENIELYSR